jgi:hypothetical protein
MLSTATVRSGREWLGGTSNSVEALIDKSDADVAGKVAEADEEATPWPCYRGSASDFLYQPGIDSAASSSPIYKENRLCVFHKAS